MAKQGKVRPARHPQGKDALLIRSAESIGRVIGTLQRQIDETFLRDERAVSNNSVKHATRRANGESNGASRRTGAAKRAAAKK